jgi:hypothetical protein
MRPLKALTEVKLGFSLQACQVFSKRIEQSNQSANTLKIIQKNRFMSISRHDSLFEHRSNDLGVRLLDLTRLQE